MRIVTGIAAMVLVLALHANAQNKKVVGTESARRTDQLMSKVKWHTDFDAALAEAKKQHKPLLWLQLVGDLDGGL